MKKRLVFLPICLISLVCLIIGIFFDLQINQAISQTPSTFVNIFTLFFAILGETPGYCGTCFLIGIVLACAKRLIKNKVIVFFAYFFCVIGIISCAYLEGDSMVEPNVLGSYIDGIDHIYFAIPVGLLLTTPLLLFGYFFGKRINDPNKLWIAVFALASIFFVIFFVVVLKDFYSRPRYRFIISDEASLFGGIDLFHRVFVPFNRSEEILNALPSVSDGEFDSFPSGHAGMSSVCMMLFFVSQYYFPAFKKHNTFIVYGGFAFTLVVSFSRIFCGAHFLTDVSVPIFLATILYTIAIMIIVPKYETNEK